MRLDTLTVEHVLKIQNKFKSNLPLGIFFFFFFFQFVKEKQINNVVVVYRKICLKYKSKRKIRKNWVGSLIFNSVDVL